MEQTDPSCPVADPRQPVPARLAAGTARVSFCMIVKNEEAHLPACLASVAGIVDDAIVVDTGSTDHTKEIAVRAGARVVDFPWVDDFAAARNESLRQAGGDWVFWMDADDRLDDENRRRLKKVIEGLNGAHQAYGMKCLCPADGANDTATVVEHVRLFRNHPALRWQYRVHEQILPSIRRLGGAVAWSDVVIHHLGYQDPAVRRRKLERDLRLLHLSNEEQPDEPFILFNLGSVYQELGQTAEAVPLLRRSLERSHPGDSIVRKLYALLVQCYRRLGQADRALAACRAGRNVYPDDAELLFHEGLLRRQLDDYPGAEACLRRLLLGREQRHFASVHAGLRGYLARHNLAVVYHEQGCDIEAEAQWRTALKEQPGYAPALLGLGELYLTQQRWQELEETAADLENERHDTVEASILRARGHLARKEFALARHLLDPTITRAPQRLGPRVLLSHVLLREGHDPAAAERALRDILALDPAHTQARHNLELLLHQQGRSIEAACLANERALAEMYQAKGDASSTPSGEGAAESPLQRRVS